MWSPQCLASSSPITETWDAYANLGCSQTGEERKSRKGSLDHRASTHRAVTTPEGRTEVGQR